MINIHNLSKCYGKTTVLNNISCTIQEGETVSIIGPSGAGKSVFLRCINFLETPTSGTVSFQNTVLNKDNIHNIRKSIGMVFQHFNLFNTMTVLENILYAPCNVLGQKKALAQEKAYQLLQQVGLTHKAKDYPHSLSGGQKQRVAILRALAMQPKVLLLDEPTSALDPEMVKEVLDVIQSVAHHGMTVILVTHEMGFAKKISDRILFFAQGTIEEEGTPDSFFNTPQSPRAQEFLSKVLSI